MEGSLVAYKVFTNGSVLNASEVNDNLMNQAVITFTNSAARASAITSPVEGMVTYLADTDTYEFWNGTAWGNLVSQAGLEKIYHTTFSAVNSISLPNDTFTTTFDNYRIMINVDSISSSSALTTFRLRASGTDDDSANYTFANHQRVTDATTYVAVNGVSQTSGRIGFLNTGDTGSAAIDVFNPKKAVRTLVQSTFTRFTSAPLNLAEEGNNGFALTTSFDSFTYLGINMTGSISVYGYGKA